MRIQLTSRQLQIISMPRAEKRHVPFPESYELGKLLIDAMQGDNDTMLRQMEKNALFASEFVDEP